MKFLTLVLDATISTRTHGPWIPALGEALVCPLEFGNVHDPYAVAVCKATIC